MRHRSIRRYVHGLGDGDAGDIEVVNVDAYAPDYSSRLVGDASAIASNIDFSLLNLAPPTFLTALPATAPTSTIYNPATRSADTGMSVADWTKTLTQLATLGVRTYATVNQIEQGNSAPYALPPTTQPIAPVVAPADATPGILDGLTDFSTPTPYIAIGVVALLLVTMSGRQSRRGR